jgi:flagellar basal body rod protein FlgB
MNQLSVITDNVAELLVKILEFTHLRQRVLIHNVHNLNNLDFLPKDLPVEEFCNVLNRALAEHIQYHRLLLQDTDNVTFRENGMTEITPLVDEEAKTLLRANPDQYIELQLAKLLENSLNYKLAAELLRQKQVVIPALDKLTNEKTKAWKAQLKDIPIE